MNKQRIIVVGGSGFIGYNLIKRLLRDGYENIIVIDHNVPKVNVAQNVIGDFFDIGILSRIIKKDDIVIHSACSTIPASSEKERIRDIEENIIGTIRLLDICAEKKIQKFIFISSGGTVYSSNEKKPMKEIDNNNPINSHGVMKLSTEKYIQVYQHLYDMPCVIARLANPYGKLSSGKKNQGIIDAIMEKIVRGEMIEVWGNGDIVRDYIFIDDVADFFAKIIEKTNVRGIFNVGTGVGTSINELLKIIKKVVKKDVQIKYSNGRIFDAPYSVLDVSKAKKILDWKPHYNIDQGIKKIYDSLTK